jgi:hypothetical protein
MMIQEVDAEGKGQLDQFCDLSRRSGPRSWIECGEEFSTATMVYVPVAKQAGNSCEWGVSP